MVMLTLVELRRGDSKLGKTGQTWAGDDLRGCLLGCSSWNSSSKGKGSRSEEEKCGEEEHVCYLASLIDGKVSEKQESWNGCCSGMVDFFFAGRCWDGASIRER